MFKRQILFITIIFLLFGLTSAWADGLDDPKAPRETQREKLKRVVDQKMKEINTKATPKEVPPVGSPQASQGDISKKPSRVDSDLSEMIEKSEREAGLRSAKQKDYTHQGNDTVYVEPEKKTFVDFSRTDVNRIHCEGDRDLSGAVFSEDKGLVVNRSGSNAFLRIIPEAYAYENPFELFLICSKGGGESSLYRVIGNPVMELSKNVILRNTGEKMQEALNFFKGKSREQSIVELVKRTWEENWDGSWTITPRFKNVVEKPEYKVTWYRTIDTNTEFVVEVYAIEAMGRAISIPEETFINSYTAAVSIFDPIIEPGKLGQVVVIREKTETL